MNVTKTIPNCRKYLKNHYEKNLIKVETNSELESFRDMTNKNNNTTNNKC